MFDGCDKIINIDFFSFNAKYIKNMRYMFYGCENLKNINLYSFNTASCKDISHMFEKCKNLEYLDLSSFKINNLIDMGNMFKECFKLNKQLNKQFLKRLDFKQELIQFLLINAIKDEKILKINVRKISNEIPFFSFTSKIDYDYNKKDYIKSHFILISNDIIIIPTKSIIKENDKTNFYLSFPQIKEDIPLSIFNTILENDNYNNNISIIKILNKNFLFQKYFEIFDYNIDIESSEKFIINAEGKEESLNINNSDYQKDSPIYIKRNNKLILIGRVNEMKKLYYFNKQELMDIKKKIENIELKFKLYQIKKLDFSKEPINDDEMQFIFQYDYINLEYLNLERNNLSNEGLKALQNKFLKNLSYLNISSNAITDEGLKYLNELSNLKELILNKMNKLSDDYFLSLKSNSFINSLNILKCDKKKLKLEYVNSNYNKFSLPNLTCLKIISDNTFVHKYLKYLFPLDNICSKITDLDLSNTGITDNGMLRLVKNIFVFKKIKHLNLENTQLTTESQKYIDQLNKLNIKITFNNLKTNYQKEYTICLGGSTISGKTTYINTYRNKSFFESYSTTIGFDIFNLQTPKPIDKEVFIFDTACWGGRYDRLNQNYLINADGVLLLFDLSSKDDFDGLPHCLDMITDFYELEDFPVLLIGNKSDLKKEVNEEEIKQFQINGNFIGYFEISCKNLRNVNESLDFLINYLYEKEKKFSINDKDINKIRKK